MPPIDPITAEVISKRFRAATDEMLATLFRTAFSPNVKERRDCSTACFNVDGDLVSLSAVAPIHLSSLSGMVQNLVRRVPLAEIADGDMYLLNDPYVGGGSHLPDLTLTSPVFFDGRIVAFVASTAHHSDIGGKAAGSESGDCTSIFQEGLRIPPVKLMAAGELRQDILDILNLNSRTPAHRDGDMKAQMAANLIGIRRVRELFTRFGYDLTIAGVAALFDHSEARVRAAISKLKPGIYENEDFLDHDGVEAKMTRLKLTVTVGSDSIRFDFSGTDPQMAGARNCVMVATLANVFHALQVVTEPNLPPNQGFYRAVEVTAPLGSVLNCVAPAPVGDRGRTCQVIGDLLFGALSKAAPNRVLAGCGSSQGMVFSGYDTRSHEYVVDYDVYAGGAGAQFDRDGMDAVRVHANTALSMPIESTEYEFPLIVERCEMLRDSGGPGRFRGGMGLVMDISLWAEQAKVSGRGLRHGLAPPGLFGGEKGRVARFTLSPENTAGRKLEAVFSELALPQGAVIRVETPSGGGFGNPLERDPDSVLADLKADKISLDGAERDYGVVIVDGSIDADKTFALRKARKNREEQPA